MSAAHTPECVTHKLPMQPRPIGSQTAEQRWCGMWFDCTACTNSTLIPSPELAKLYPAKATGQEGGAA